MSLVVIPRYNWEEERRQIDDWINQNRPDPIKSQSVYQAFVQRYASHIRGSDAFVDKITKIFEKASSMASGILALERLSAADKEHKIFFDEETKGKGAAFDSSSFIMELDFCSPTRKYHYVGVNDKGERVFGKSSSVTTFIHECMHAIEHLENEAIASKRGEALGVPLEWDLESEEMAIRGQVGIDEGKSIDFCCENVAHREERKELKRFLRINHHGARKVDYDLQDIVENRILVSLRELAKTSSISCAKEKQADILESAFCLYFLEEDPKVLCEWIEIIQILIKAGVCSDEAMRLALIQNSEDILSLLSEMHGSFEQKIQQSAYRPYEDRLEAVWNILVSKKFVVRSFENDSDNNLPIAIPDGQRNPLDKKVEKWGRQRAAVQDKLDFHTMKRGFNEEVFALPCCTEVPQQRFYGVFDLTKEGACVPSATPYTHYYPACYKSKDLLELGKGNFFSRPFFKREEVIAFLQALNPHPRVISSLADHCSGDLMKVTGIGYEVIKTSFIPSGPHFPVTTQCNEVRRDDQLEACLSHYIEKQILDAFSNPNQFVLNSYASLGYDVWARLDIPMMPFLSMEGMTLSCVQEKYETLTSPIECRLVLEENLFSESATLNFCIETFIGGKRVSRIGLG